MTEQDWLECTDPAWMLDSLRKGTITIRDHASDRKLRLFAVGCCCRISRLLTDQRSVDAVLVTDRYADGMASADELGEAITAARKAYENAFQTRDDLALRAVTFLAADGYYAATYTADYAAHAVGNERAARGASQTEFLKTFTERETSRTGFNNEYSEGRGTERVRQAELLRHVIGNPFRRISFAVSWRTSTVIGIAQAIYEERAFDRLPVLADALEESGCTNADILAHCRGPGPHVRGCWALDLILGKS